MEAQTQHKERPAILASYLIVGAMMACLAVSLVQLGELAFPGWGGGYLVALGFLVALESMYSRRALKGRYFPEPEWLWYRGSEAVVIALAVKLFYYLQHGLGRLWLDIPLWFQDFFAHFSTTEFGFGCLVMALVWAVSGQFASDLIVLEVDERLLRAEAESGIYEQRDQARERIASAALGIGVVMIVLAAMLRTDMLARWVELPGLRAGVLNLLAYFLLTLVLLSLAQYSLLRTGWLRERMSIDRRIAARWILYSFGLILGLAVVSRLLPTGYSLGPLTVLGYLLYILSTILTIVMMLVVTPIILFLAWLMSLFGGRGERLPPLPMPAQSPLRFSPAPAGIPWLELLKSILFWAVLLSVVGYSLTHYVRERQDLREALRRAPFFPALASLWKWLRGLVGAANRNLSAAVGVSLERLRNVVRRRRDPAQPWGYLSLRRLSSRQRVRFYYLAMVRRGGEAGISRRPSQTPAEYSRSLAQGLLAGESSLAQRMDPESPPLDQDIEALTEGFNLARYSLHLVEAGQENLARRCWERIRRALRRLPGGA
jgi:hypothetical protein